MAYLFETTSEGVLTRDFVPGSCVLYIRDTLKSTILWSRQNPNDQEAEAPEAPLIDPKPEEPDVFPDAVEGDPAPLSGGPETIITKEDLVQDILMPTVSAPLALQDVTASDLLPEEAPVLDEGGVASPPESRKREADKISVTLEVEEEVGFDADDTLQPPLRVAVIEHASTAEPNTSSARCCVWDAVGTLSSHPLRSNANALKLRDGLQRKLHPGQPESRAPSSHLRK